MSTSIEQRVVQMKFDNKQFEQGVAQSMSTLDKLKAKLNFKGAADSFDSISKAADSVSLNNLVKETDTAGSKFDALAIIAISALNRITNEAITAGTQLVKSLSIDQVSAGWSKYEARTAAVQTLVNATGRSVQDIERYMDKLMLYSDETSYGFGDMTSALATMVSAGGDIEKLVPLLEGFGNAVSFVGKGAAEYSRAVIQLSQGYGRNALMLEDWKSIEQTLGGAKQLKEVFIEVAEAQGKIAKGNITIGTFNESLRNKWLDQEVMEEALGRFGEMTERAFEMVEAGEVETVAQAYEILSQSVDDYRIKAAKAAQEAKSFTEAIDATKDAVSTKWMESFQIIFGNYEEATKLWTELTNTLYEIFATAGDVRNEILTVWKSLGGRDHMIMAFKNAFEALAKPLSAVREAIQEIFFPGSTYEKGMWLVSATNAARAFFKTLILSDEACQTLKIAFKALLLPVQALVQVVRIAWAAFTGLIQILATLINTLLALPQRLDIVEKALRKVFGDERYEKIAKAWATVTKGLSDAFSVLVTKLKDVWTSFKSAFSSNFVNAFNRLKEALAPIGEWILDRIVDGFELLSRIDYGRIADWAIVAVDTLIAGFEVLKSGVQVAIGAVKGFFVQFKDMDAIQILNALVDGVMNLKTNFQNFLTSIGFDQVMDSIKDGTSGVIDILAKFGEVVKNLIGRLTPAKIVVFGFGVSLVWVFTNLATAIAAFKGIAEGVTGVLGAITGTLKAFQQRLKGSPILQVAVAIGVLAASLGLLAQIPANQLLAAAGAMAILIGVIGALAVGMAFVNKFVVKTPEMAKNLIQLSTSMLVMAGAVALLTGALIALTKVDLGDLLLRLIPIAGSMLVLIGSVALVGKLAKTETSSILAILAFAVSLNLMIGAIAKISQLELGESIANLASIAIVMTMMVALSKLTKGVGVMSGMNLILMAGSLIIFLKLIEPIAKFDFVTILAALAKILVIFGTFTLISKFVGNSDFKKLGIGLASAAAGLLIMYFAIKSLGQLDTGVLIKGTAAAGAILIFIGVMQAIANIGTGPLNGGANLKGSFLAIAAAILVLGIAINYIGGLELRRVIQGTIVVGAMMVLIGLMTQLASKAQKTTGPIVALTVCIGTLVASIALLTLLDTGEIIGAASALAIAFAGLGVMFSNIADMKLGRAIGALLVMLGALSMIGLLIGYLTDLENIDSVLPAATGVGIILLALGGSLALLQQNEIFNTANLKRIGNTLTMMLGMLILAGGALTILSNIIDKPDKLIEKSIALGIVLLSLGESMSLFNLKTGKLSTVAKNAGIMLAITSLAVGALAILNLFEDSTGLIIKATALSEILLVMTGAIAILSLLSKGLEALGKSSGAALSGAWEAIKILGIITLVALAVGGLFTVWEDLDVMLDKAMEVIPKIGLMIGEFFGAIVGGLVSGVGMGICFVIEQFGLSLSRFAENAQGFISLKVDSGLVSSIGSLAAAILLITGAEMLNAIMTFGTGGLLLENFGTSLENFAPHFVNFANKLGEIDDKDAVIASTQLLDSVASVMSEIPTEGGIWGAIFGNKDLDKFGSGLSTLATGVVDYANILSEAEVDDDTISKTNSLVTTLVNLASSLPTTGGLMDFLVGRKDLGEFGTQLTTFGSEMKKFFRRINDIDYDDEKANAIIACSELLVDLANSIPDTGGLMTFLTGRKDLGEFGTQLVTFASGIKSFLKETATLEINQQKVEDIVSATKLLVDLTSEIPKTGVLMDFFGTQDLGAFGDDIGDFGRGIGTFFKQINDAGVDKDKVELAKQAGLAFVEISESLSPNSGITSWWESTSLETFGSDIAKLGEGLAGFWEKLDSAGVNFNEMEKAITQLERIVKLAPDIENVNKTAANNFKEFLKTLAETGIDEFIDTFDDAEDDLYDAIFDTIDDALWSVKSSMTQNSADYGFIADTIINALALKRNDLITEATNMLNTIKNTFTEKSYILSEAGDYILNAIVNALSDPNGTVTMAIAKLANKMIKAAMLELDVAGSYSREFVKIGRYVTAGLIKGLEENENAVYSVVANVGRNTAASFQRTLSIQSPSKEFEEFGMYIMLGLSNGITDNYPTVKKSVVKMGENMLGSMRSFWGIKSPSIVARDEIGRYIIAGIADGITSDTSPEEAAAQKARNIIQAFQGEFDKWALDTETADLSYQLWELLNPDASEDDKLAKQTELLDEKLKNQAERVSAAAAQYKATMETIGEDAEETQQAYNTYLQEQIAMAKLAQELVDLTVPTQEQNQEARAKYYQILTDYSDLLREAGYSYDQIEEYAKSESGYLNYAEMAEKAEGALGSVTRVIETYMKESSGWIEAVSENAEAVVFEAGSSLVGSYIKGATSAATGAGGAAMATTVEQAVEKALNDINENTSLEWAKSGGYAGQGYLDGFNNKLQEWGSAATDLIGSGINAVCDFLQINSPSKVTEQHGEWIAEGYIIGLENGSIGIMNAVDRIISYLKTVMNELPSSWSNVGAQMCQGMARGLYSNASLVTSAARSVAGAALNAAMQELGIHSPSREYYSIGELMDQGLANGIINGTDVVQDAMSCLLANVQKTINSAGTYISPVVSSDTSSLKKAVSAYNKQRSMIDDGQRLIVDSAGNLVPYGYSDHGSGESGTWWISQTSDIASSIRQFADSEESRKAYDAANEAKLSGTIEELGTAIKDLSSTPSVTLNQNNYSPESLSSSTIYRNTKTALATVSAAASPTKQSLKTLGTGNTY